MNIKSDNIKLQNHEMDIMKKPIALIIFYYKRYIGILLVDKERLIN